MAHNNNTQEKNLVNWSNPIKTNQPVHASSFFDQTTSGGINLPNNTQLSQAGIFSSIVSKDHDERSVTDLCQNTIYISDPTTASQFFTKQNLQQHPGRMADQFSASSVFSTSNNNNNNTDGWGDDWGDWGDNTMAQQKPSPPQATASRQPMNTNQYFQPQPQFHQQQQFSPQQQFQPQPFPSQQSRLDQSNENFVSYPTPGEQQQIYQSYPTSSTPSTQQHFSPNYPQQQQQTVYPPAPQQQQHQHQQQQYVQQPVSTNHYQQASQRPPSQPSASKIPQYSQQTLNQTISDSFSTSATDTWNWNLSTDSHHASSPKPPTLEPQPQSNAFKDNNFHQVYTQQNMPLNNVGSQNNTQPQQSPKIQVAQIARLKNETISPQWSIESQVSQTSSDRSIESAEIGESRSSNTIPSDDGTSERNRPLKSVENYEYIEQCMARSDVPAKLERNLNPLHIKQERQQDVSETVGSENYAVPTYPPPHAIDTKIPPPVASSVTPPLPPFPSEIQPPQAPPPAHTPPPNKETNANPFKRVGQRSHLPTPGLGTTQLPPPVSSNFNLYQPPSQPVEMANIENPTVPENQEIPEARVENIENLELAPSNDRNQYLQTGHLSEEGYNISQAAPSNDQPAGDDSLPPPGLSRYVPGQQQSENNQQLVSSHFPEPPPGLDRMIPGTDLENNTDPHMERQIDGEVSDSASNSNVRTGFSSVSQTQQDHRGGDGHRHRQPEEIIDRNLYLVPGESDTHHNQQRVIPGVEDDRPIQSANSGSNYAAQAHVVQTPVEIPINEQQRELVMDGANPHDPPPLVPTEIARDEPIEGGNPLDKPAVIHSETVTIPEIDTNIPNEAPRKDPSNTSTADESDKDRPMLYSKDKSSRRDDDPLRRSMRSKSSRDRYDTEDSDYSDRARRRRERESSGGVEGQHRERRRGDRDNDKERRKDGGRDRDRDRDYDYRDKEKSRYDRERERYGRSNKYDRDSRYETDGSKYETERSARYDKDGDGSKRYMTREEYYRKREERVGAEDRRYRKEKDRERGDRYRDEKKKDDRYRDNGDKRRDRHDRRYEYEDYRTGSRNGFERDRDRDRMRDSRERDDRKERDRKYPPTAAYGVPYSGGSGYYDPYNLYTQHQQYYEQLRRTNPQAYAEWYRTYYSQIQAAQIQRDLLTSDGRESVHSGRSSANDKERFNRTTPFLHQPGMYNPEDYHRHFNNQSQPSVMLNQSFLSEVSNQPSTLPMYQHQQAIASTGTFQQQPQQQPRATPLVMDRSYNADSGYYQPRIDNTDGSLKQEPSTIAMMEPERLTPRKFPEIHPIVSISCGLLVTAKNRLTINGTTDLVKIFTLGANDPTRKLFQSYPGPLMKHKTHKKSVIEFCEEQLRNGPPYCNGHTVMKSRGNSINSLHSIGSNVNRASFTLLWNYIILLLRQNGTFVGTDISELLMQNKTEFPFEPPQVSLRSTNVSGRNSSLSTTDRRVREVDADGHLQNETDECPENVETLAREIESRSPQEKKEPLSEVEITDKFRNYLIYGNISDALEWATENNLWGHALFLASKVDSRQHANVMMKFANKLTLNDPLQTLYQLLSGRTPSAVTCVLDEKWGDWRPHLAMLMSNSSAKPELIKKSITTLGDSLYNRGDLYAAHFCYLLSDVTFGRFSDVKQDGGVTVTANTVVRLILLGSSHLQRSFKEFSVNESIMMTEVYEYARSLNEERYSITELQYYKYLLACRMLDYGMQLKCLLYMEQIAEQIQLDPYVFDSEFIKKVYTLGDRLKYYDPVLEKALDESVDNIGQGNIYSKVEDPIWLQRLSSILHGHNSTRSSNALDQANSAGTQDYNSSSHYGSYTGYTADQSSQQQQLSQVASREQSLGPTDINEQFNEISQQLGQLNLQYTDGYDQSQQKDQASTHLQYDNQTAALSYDQDYDPAHQSSLPDESHLNQQQQVQPDTREGYDQQQQAYAYGYNASQGQPTMFAPTPVASQDMQQSSPYGYWGANSEVPQPTISMPNSNRSGYDDENHRTSTQHSPHSAHPQQQKHQDQIGVEQSISGDPTKRGPSNKDSKPAVNSQSANSGWFGGIWNKLSLKPKNQMILPDDKNPTIVWDPEKKRWVNTESDEAVEESFKPPPKMADLMPTSSAPPQASTPISHSIATIPSPTTYAAEPSPHVVEPPSEQPLTMSQGTNQSSTTKIGEPTKVPTLQSNMFKMQRNRTLKKSYVDVFNPSGAAPSRPAEPILAPNIPTMHTPQGGFFVPGPTSASGPSIENSAEGGPQFYNPNQYAGGYQQ
ncbi:uncharacterized protein LOC129771134 isoform X2 [Toxorhynchites rutilus septentrionalis]|uniref:uncharacterized protein LOC129771134 isoform X2 n=1 Tax=Toxorhynchites rutilus septentrionalis TaxID=329112 RepID=UPI0024798CC4|nr:uncharacterized protein LOC129771134 isoform X2 [Toxorhynchites rutilus septentrionalis]